MWKLNVECDEKIKYLTARSSFYEKHYKKVLTENQKAKSELKHIQDSDLYKFSLLYYKVRDAVFPERIKKYIRKCFGYLKARAGSRSLCDSSCDFKPYSMLYNDGIGRIDIISPSCTLYLAEMIQQYLARIGVDCSIISDNMDDFLDIPYIVFFPHLLKRLPRCYIVYQLASSFSNKILFDEKYIEILNNAFAVFDYSTLNIDFFRSGEIITNKNKIYYLPVDYSSCLSRCMANNEKEYDVLWYGDVCGFREEHVLDELSRNFKVFVCHNVPRQELYSIIRKAKILVNINHCENDILDVLKIYEVLSLDSCVIVSESGCDKDLEERLNNIVDFVAPNDIETIVDKVRYWLSHDDERITKVKKNKQDLSDCPNAFSFFFYRFLLAYDIISFDLFYELAGSYLLLETNKICLNLPEVVERRQYFESINKYGFKIIPGLRHHVGWVGCGLSYKLIARRAIEEHLDSITICEDDVVFPEDFDEKSKLISNFLVERNWSFFSGLMADVDKVTVCDVTKVSDVLIAQVDHLVSMVFNVYNKDALQYISMWNEQNRDVIVNAIDRYIELSPFLVFVMIPFLVGHNENLNSFLWNRSNAELYENMISSSEKLLRNKVRRFCKKHKMLIFKAEKCGIEKP